MSTGNEEIMFEIGVAEHPQVKARLDSLAKSVLDTQARMTQGIERVAFAAQASGANMDALSVQMKGFGATAVMSYDELRGAISRVNAIANKKGQMVVEVLVKANDNAEAAAMAEGYEVVGDAVKSVTDSLAGMQAKAAKPAKVNFEIPDNLRTMFSELGDAASAEADAMSKSLSDAVNKLPNSLAGVTHKIKAEYEKRVAIQSSAYNKMAEDLDEAQAAQGDASERMNSNVVKGTRSILGAVKGFAELGIAGEENTQLLLQGLVKIQGAFDIMDGAVDLLEAFNGGYKAVRMSIDATAKASEIQKAMMGTQFAQLRAYQVTLTQEAIAANVATAANQRLAASRGVGGVAGKAGGVAVDAAGNAVAKAAGSAGASAAGGVAGKVAGGAAVGAGAAGAGSMVMSGTFAGITTGLLGTAAAFVAAIGGAALAATVVTESLAGVSDKQGSASFTIASFEASVGSSIIQMTGLQGAAQTVGGFLEDAGKRFPLFGARLEFAGGILKDFGALAESSVKLAKAEKAFKANKAKNDLDEGKAELDRGAGADIDQLKFEERVATRRNDSSINRNEAAIMREGIGQSKSSDRLSELQKVIEQFKSGESSDAGGFAKAVAESASLQADILNSIGTQQSLMDDTFNERLREEESTQSEAIASLAASTQRAADASDRGAKGADEQAKAVAQMRVSEEAITASKERQRSLVSEQSRTAIDAQGKVQDSLKKQLDIQTSSMDKLVGGYRSAATNFSKLGDIEKDLAKKALAKGRKSGGASLSDEEQDVLTQVGGEEATRLVNEANMAEAKAAGFDQSFGDGFQSERDKIENQTKSIQAKLDASYQVAVDVKIDEVGLVTTIVDQMNDLLGQKNASVMAQVNARLETFKVEMFQKAVADLKAVKAGNTAASG